MAPVESNNLKLIQACPFQSLSRRRQAAEVVFAVEYTIEIEEDR
jgi:hypothetical protein